MRVLRGRATDPKADLAVTEAALERTRETGTPTLRVWRPPRHVSFGRRDVSDPGYERAREAAESAGFPTVVRSPGGGPVAYTGTTVAVALCHPNEDPRSGLLARYDDLVRPLQRALVQLGVPVDRGEPAGAFCPGGHSLSSGGKLVGTAQRVRKHASLVGAVVVVDGHRELSRVLAPVHSALSRPFDADAVGSIVRAGGRAAPDAVVSEIESALVGDRATTVEFVGSGVRTG